jgi:N-acetylneuraminic acid mutarotase
MPTSRANFGIATVHNKIYVIGGSQEGTPLSTNEEYDPATNRWTTKTPMPTARGQTSASVLNNKIYVTGGIEYAYPGNVQKSSKIEVYDPATDTWEMKPDMPFSVADHTSAGIDDKIYVIDVESLWIYDSKSETWTIGATPPKDQTNSGVGIITDSIGRKLIINLGGGSGFSINGINQLYHPQSDSWLSGAPMPTHRKNLAVAVVDNYVYAIGGHVKSGSHSVYEYFKPTDTVERYTPLLDYSTLPSPTPTSTPTSTPVTPTPSIDPTPIRFQDPTTIILGTIAILVIVGIFAYFKKYKKNKI